MCGGMRQVLVDWSDCYRDRPRLTTAPFLPSLPLSFLYYSSVSIAFEYSVAVDNERRPTVTSRVNEGPPAKSVWQAADEVMFVCVTILLFLNHIFIHAQNYVQAPRI